MATKLSMGFHSAASGPGSCRYKPGKLAQLWFGCRVCLCLLSTPTFTSSTVYSRGQVLPRAYLAVQYPAYKRMFNSVLTVV